MHAIDHHLIFQCLLHPVQSLEFMHFDSPFRGARSQFMHLSHQFSFTIKLSSFFVPVRFYSRLWFQVLECHLVTDPRTGESRGFAFVTMETAADADRCINYLNRSVLEGRLIIVEKVLFPQMDCLHIVFLF